MANTITSRLKNAWDAFRDKNDTYELSQNDYWSNVTTYKPDRVRMHYSNERSIVNSIFNRIAVDVSQMDIRHVMTDPEKNGRYIDTVDSY